MFLITLIKKKCISYIFKRQINFICDSLKKFSSNQLNGRKFQSYFFNFSIRICRRLLYLELENRKEFFVL
jgi:hypothetical protein